MPWNKTVLSALLAGIILSAALAENANAQVPIRPRPSPLPEQLHTRGSNLAGRSQAFPRRRYSSVE